MIPTKVNVALAVDGNRLVQISVSNRSVTPGQLSVLEVEKHVDGTLMIFEVNNRGKQPLAAFATGQWLYWRFNGDPESSAHDSV